MEILVSCTSCQGATGSLYLTSALGSSAVENGEDGVQRLPSPRRTLEGLFYSVVLRQWTMENGDTQTKKM